LLTPAQRALVELLEQERGRITTVYFPAGATAALRAVGYIDANLDLTPAGRTYADRLRRMSGPIRQNPRTHSLGGTAKPPRLLF
jgi:hypothetical protein